MLCAIGNSKNVNEEWLQTYVCELCFQHKRHGHCNVTAKQKKLGRMRVKKDKE